MLARTGDNDRKVAITRNFQVRNHRRARNGDVTRFYKCSFLTDVMTVVFAFVVLSSLLCEYQSGRAFLPCNDWLSNWIVHRMSSWNPDHQESGNGWRLLYRYYEEILMRDTQASGINGIKCSVLLINCSRESACFEILRTPRISNFGNIPSLSVARSLWPFFFCSWIFPFNRSSPSLSQTC